MNSLTFLKICLCVFLTLNLVSPAAFAEADEEKKDATSDKEISEILNTVGYPELQVVPRASERLRLEAKAERGSWFYMHWPVQLSGLATLYVGMTAKSQRKDDLSASEKDDAQTVAMVTQAVGASWLIGGLVLGFQHPYSSGMRYITSKKPPGKDDRSMLLRERLAEEALERPARVMRVLEYVSVITNFTATTLNGLYAKEEGWITVGVGAVLAFLPLMFTDHSIQVYDKHIEYKKKIYAPLKTGSLRYDPDSKTFTPMTHLIWAF